MLIQLDRTQKGRFLYQEIYRQIKQLILNNELRANTKLPPKRELAQMLDVSTNSIANAYEQLLAEGYIYTIERVGYFIEEIEQFDINPNVTTAFPTHLREQPEPPKTWLSLSHMNSNARLFPMRKWLSCEAKVYDRYIEELGEMAHTQGPYVLRKNIAELIYATRGVKCEPEQIVVHATSQGLLERLIRILPENPSFAVENPGYARYYQLLKRHHIQAHLVPLDDAGIDVHHLEQLDAQLVIATPSHQFPTGTIMPISRRVELLNWASRQEDRYIIEDDYDSEFKYETNHVPSLQSMDYNHKVIYMGTFSKTLLPGIRVSYMVLPVKLLESYREMFPLEIQAVNTLVLYTLNEFIESGQYEKHLRKMTKHFEEVRSCLVTELTKQLGDQIIISDVPAGLHFLIEAKSARSYDEIEQQAAKHNVEVYTLKRFSLNPYPLIRENRFIIIGFAYIDMKDIPEAVRRLGCVLFDE
ncbi:hypothetical protein QI30_04275 [Kurthia sp. 3B1D]|uniref:HTH gntR-type domain-containing protein n=1 Tax=Candidatus Kurthia intestinigallinarum TaxID=1562256 RepID=A0A433RWV1_9BACL|nr:PLP-dependent aminotransferase family protein [Kurthia sp. 3B1D]RUS57776.1 hypothetical protein QI30_04275 [Kurthia sp. 3B1D]